MKTLDGQTIFTYMTGISDIYIEEAAYPQEIPTIQPSKPTLWQRMSDFFNHPVGVALICGVVAIGVLVGIVMAGRNPPPTPAGHDTSAESQASETTTPLESNIGPFSFSYEVEQNMLLPNQAFWVKAFILNLGDAFSYTDVTDSFYPSATLVHHDSETQITPTKTRTPNGNTSKTFRVEPSQSGEVLHYFTIPNDAPVGEYDLILTYDQYTKTFPSAITVVRNAINADGKLSAITLGKQTIDLVYQTTTQAYSNDPWLDEYLGSDGVIYSFLKDTYKLYYFKNLDIRGGKPEIIENITQEEAKAIADEFLLNYNMIPRLDAYKVEMSGNAKNGYFFQYEHYLGQTSTWYEVRIGVNHDGIIFSYYVAYWSENLPYITETDIEAAKARFFEKYPHLTSCYVHPSDGMLCIQHEEIVSAPMETDKEGNEIGCGHEHIFYTEIITPSKVDESETSNNG